MKNKHNTTQREKLLRIVEEYAAQTGFTELDMDRAADWALVKGKWSPPAQDLKRQLSRLLAQACREDYSTDPQGRRVRTRHAFTVQKKSKDGKPIQQYLWVKGGDATRDQMEAAFQHRRYGIVKDCVQLSNDVESYNDNHNPGPPIQPSFNFELDVALAQESDSYDPGEVEADEIEAETV